MNLFSTFSRLKSFKTFGEALVLACCFSAVGLYAKGEETRSVEDRYGSALTAFQKKEYKAVLDDAKYIIQNAPATPLAAETTFFLAVSYFNLKDFDLANHYFSQFLEKYATKDHFEDAIEYKYKIAEEFEMGSGRHMFGIEKLPKWVSAWDDAIELYDEVIKTLPNHEVAAKALYRKAGMLKNDRKFKEALEAYRTITRRFPKHPLAPESYLAIAKAYFDQSKIDYPDKAFLQQARLNYKRFRKDFPSEERLIEAEALLVQMQDSYAKELWVSAQYFEKKKKYDAARLYYEKIARLYPESTYAKEAVAKLSMADASVNTASQQEEIAHIDESELKDQNIEA